MDFTWQKEIDLYRKIRTGIILEGNVSDLQPYGSMKEFNLVSLDHYLYNYLHDQGYKLVIYFNHVQGFYGIGNPKEFTQFEEEYRKIQDKIANNPMDTRDSAINHDPDEDHISSEVAKIFSVNQTIKVFERNSKIYDAVKIISDVFQNSTQPIAFVLNHASRYITDNSNLTDREVYFFSELKVLLSKMNNPKNPENKSKNLSNLVFMVADRVNDLPPWFYLNNPLVRTINIPQPDRELRKQFFMNHFEEFLGHEAIKDTKEKDNLISQFSGITEGINNRGLYDLQTIMQREKIPLKKIKDAVNLLKYGVQDNPWDNDDLKNRVSHMAKDLEKRVKGQDEAIQEVTDIVTRAIYGLSGLTHSNSRAKPRGIMFFAGPTGTGKTELAKAIAEWIFGSEEAMIRFDMTEFQASQTDQRLLGAPPGYVGYEAGGELTSAVRAKPFSVILFDEIEKANTTILDKFLQILEDGRMTDGRGETVYFSDTVIIFTSNLGMTKKVRNAEGKEDFVIKYNDDLHDYKGYKQKVLETIADEFKVRIQRPELLNRMGENVIVFRHIYEDIAKRIADRQIERIIERIKDDLKINLVLEDSAKKVLYVLLKKGSEKGGRGVSNILEKHFLNPLARIIASQGIKEGESLIINQIETIDDVSSLIVK
jgi:ATP-dependent Clp protease ATP-binding subunit ClpA